MSSLKRLASVLLIALWRYKVVRGAVIVKLVQYLLTVSGHAPWSVDQAHAVEIAIDGIVLALFAFGVFHAHNADPAKG